MLRIQSTENRPGGRWVVTDRLSVQLNETGLSIFVDGEYVGIIYLSDFRQMFLRVGRRLIHWKSRRI